MKFSLNWLRRYVDLDESVDGLSHAITFLGLEVEGVERIGLPPLENVVVGEVLTREKHPDADRLSLCTVDAGPEHGKRPIVCGADNFAPGDRVVVALPGAVLPGDFKIKSSKIRGQISEGMMCSPRELNYADDAEGLLILTGRPEVGTPVNEALPGGDVVFDVEITPNRPDCLSHLGLARELAAWFRRELRYPEIRFSGRPADATPAPDVLEGVRVEHDEDCPLYTAHLIRGVRIEPSPAWMQDLLRAAGLRPINNIVDITNFVLLETGQPLHAFDARKIGGRRLVIRRAAPGERLTTLDGKDRALTDRMLVIADANKPLVVAGIMGGDNAEVDDRTADLVLEAAYFRPGSVRQTSRMLGLASDSSHRFERGVDPHGVLEAARRAVDLILEVAGGEAVGPVFQEGAPAVSENEIRLSPDFVRDRLGFDIDDAGIRGALEALELSVNREEEDENGGPVWTVSIPSWRGDLDRPIDLVEEVLRLYGTDRIPAGRVMVPAILMAEDPVVAFNRRAGDLLAAQGYHECVNYTLCSGEELQSWVSRTSAAELALANPVSEDQTHLRSTLLISLLGSLRINQARGVDARRLFETGRVFVESNGHIFETAAAAFLVCEPKEDLSWLRRDPADFYTVRSLIESVAAYAGVDVGNLDLDPMPGSWQGWQEGHAASAGDLEADGWSLRFGMMNLAMVHSLGIHGRVHAGMFTILPGKLSSENVPRQYRPVSAYPAAIRDLALVVAEETPAETVRRSVERAARAAVGAAFEVEGVSIFDLYRGKELPEGRKSLAFSLAFRSHDRTLTDEEVNNVLRKIQQAITGAGEYQVRG